MTKERVKFMKETVCFIFGAIGATITSLFGGWDASLTTLLIFMVIDFLSGLAVSGVFHKSKKTETGLIKAETCFQGLCKKGMMLFFVLIGVRLDLLIGTNYIRDGVCIAFIVSELISITENAGLMGLPVPSVLMKALEVLKMKSERVDK